MNKTKIGKKTDYSEWLKSNYSIREDEATTQLKKLWNWSWQHEITETHSFIIGKHGLILGKYDINDLKDQKYNWLFTKNKIERNMKKVIKNIAGIEVKVDHFITDEIIAINILYEKLNTLIKSIKS